MKKKYFFVTEVVPLLTLGLCPLIFIVFFFITIIIFKVSSCWFGEAIHCGCKTKVFFFFLKKDPKGRTFGRGAQCYCAGMLFHISFVKHS